MRLVSRSTVGFCMSDFRALAARVFCAGGALRSAAALVFDLVLLAGAEGGAEAMRRRRLTVGARLIGSCAVVGTTLGAGVGIAGMLLAIERVMRLLIVSLVSSTLGTGCTLGLAIVWGDWLVS